MLFVQNYGVLLSIPSNLEVSIKRLGENTNKWKVHIVANRIKGKEIWIYEIENKKHYNITHVRPTLAESFDGELKSIW